MRFTPACGGTPVPVCLNPAYAGYLSVTAGALAPLLRQLAGLPGAPTRIVQEPVTYRQGRDNSVTPSRATPWSAAARRCSASCSPMSCRCLT